MSSILLKLQWAKVTDQFATSTVIGDPMSIWNAHWQLTERAKSCTDGTKPINIKVFDLGTMQEVKMDRGFAGMCSQCQSLNNDSL